MNARRFGISGLIGAAGALWWAWAQPAPQPLEAFVPAGSLVFLEAKDFAALLQNWDSSAEKAAWLQSANYSVFSRSHLFLRLGDAQAEFASAAGLPANYALLSSVAGTNSVLAMYDIGKLEFLYIARLPSARALNTSLWRNRATYQTRRAGNVDYYVKVDAKSQRSAAFAYTGDLLLLATRESALAGALQLIAQQGGTSIGAEPWFAQATTSAEPGSRELRLVYNMERLATTPQFRSHWIQGNAAALREFGSGLADLERVQGEFRERRVMLRTNASADLSTSEADTGTLLAMVPDAAGLYRVHARPTPEQAERWIAQKLFATNGVSATRPREAPAAQPEDGVQGDEADLEVRVDEQPFLDDRAQGAFASLRALLAGSSLRSMLETSSTGVEANQVFVGPQNAMVFFAEQPWNLTAVQNALRGATDRLWTQGRVGTDWKPSGVGQELTGLGKLIVAVDGNRLIVGDSPELVAAVWARRNQAPVAGAVYAAGWRHARELPNFERMMRLIDFPEIRALEGSATREPMFYSENLASLGRVLGQVQQVSIAAHDNGAAVREQLVYRLTP